MFDKNFMGLDGFVWFIGVVEDRKDPLALGRVRVRACGWHSASLADIPSEDLPWASVLQPPTGIFNTPKEADVVVGFFADGRSGQIPIVLGILPGFSTVEPSTGQGFNDLRSLDQLKLSPRKPVARNYNTDGSGIEVDEINAGSNTALESLRYPQADQLQEQSITGVSRYEIANTAIEARKQNLDKNITTAEGLKWSEPYPAYNALYPHNKAYESESGHIVEYDDTPGHERICVTHRSGSFVEVYPSGSKVEKITKSNYQIVMADDHVHIMGRALLTIDQGSYIKILGNAHIEVGNDAEMKVSGQMNLSVKEALNIKAKSLNIDVEENSTIVAGESQFITVGSGVHLKGEEVRASGSGGNLEVTDSVIATGGGGASVEVSGSVKASGSGGGAIEVASGFVAEGGGASLGVASGQVKGGPLLLGNTSGGSASSASSAGAASEGIAAGIEAAADRSMAKSGRPTEEEVPVPFDAGTTAQNLDAYTGYALSKKRFLDANGDGTTSEPLGDDTEELVCNFDPNSKVFIPKKQWAISSNGLNLIKKQEGYAKRIANGMAQGYPDPATGGEPYTIGYGTTSAVVNVKITLQTVIDKATAEQWLLEAINEIFLPKLKDTVNSELTQNQIDACLSLMYNIGTGAWATSTVKNRINSGNWCGAAEAILWWRKADGRVIQGLVNRRNEERSLFLS